MGKKPPVPTVTVTSPDGDQTLVLSCVLSAGSRTRVAEMGNAANANAASTVEDVRQNVIGFLFGALVREWRIHGAPITKQRALAERFRMASTAERAFVVDAMRAHCDDWFPGVRVP